MNGMWGYKITDQDYKSAETLIRYLVRAAGRDANLLLNIGPQPDGRLPAAAVERLKEMGKWLKRYGESIYGTRGGDIPPHGGPGGPQRDRAKRGLSTHPERKRGPYMQPRCMYGRKVSGLRPDGPSGPPGGRTACRAHPFVRFLFA